LLDAQRQYQQTRIDYSRALANRYQDTAALFQALGGNWNDNAIPEASSSTNSAQAATTPQ
jgi:outer membrane protein TolC